GRKWGVAKRRDGAANRRFRGRLRLRRTDAGEAQPRGENGPLKDRRSHDGLPWAKVTLYFCAMEKRGREYCMTSRMARHATNWARFGIAFPLTGRRKSQCFVAC